MIQYNIGETEHYNIHQGDRMDSIQLYWFAYPKPEFEKLNDRAACTYRYPFLQHQISLAELEALIAFVETHDHQLSCAEWNDVFIAAGLVGQA